MPERTALLCLLALAACGPPPDPMAPVVRQYAVMMYANFQDIVTSAQALQSAINAFVNAPSQATQDAARQAWLKTRGTYGESEIGRFYKGPIDALQGRINEWPVDENYVDYTAGNPSAGIINDPADVPEITPQVLAYYDGQGGEQNRALGYHAIEFLLWGQRPDQTQGPGQRPYTDYADGGTAAHQDRRRTYLKLAGQMLLGDLSSVRDQWDLTDPMSYASQMVARPPADALSDILRGQANMAVAELLYERMSDPYITRDEKDEESCFSESTYTDLQANILGIENVYLGRYHNTQGPSIADLVAASTPDLDAKVRQQLTAAGAAIAGIPQPFDHSVIAADGTQPRQQVKAALDALMPVGGLLAQVGQTLGITINLNL